ncbi:MAG: hypothetical protein AAF928_20960 [Myxococcota bacterium]
MSTQTPAPPRRGPMGHWVLLGAPAIAGLVTVYVLMGPGAYRPVQAARVFGYTAPGATQTAFQVQLVQFDGDMVAPGPPASLELRVDGAVEGTWRGRLDPAREEAVEATVMLSGPWTDGALSLVVTNPVAETVLAEGTLRLSSPPAVRRAPDRGNSGLAIALTRGVGAVPELPEPLTIELTHPPNDASPRLEIEVQGGQVRWAEDRTAAHPSGSGATTSEALEVDTPTTRTCSPARCVWTWSLDVIAQATSTLVTAKATTNGEMFRTERLLDLKPGALWLAPDGRSLRAASPRDHAFVSLIGPKGRWWAQRVPMTVDDLGFAVASLDLPRALDHVPPGMALLLAGESGPATARSMAWPLPRRPLSIEPPSLQLVADGLPAARTIERGRVNVIRRGAVALVVCVAGWVFFGLFLARRRAGQTLTEVLRHAAIDPETVVTRPSRGGLLWLSIALGLGFLTLSSLALVGLNLP